MTVSDERGRLISGGVRLVERGGRRALTARNLAAEACTSTMAVYTHFGGMTGVIDAVACEVLSQLADAVTSAEPTDDPVADLFLMSAAYRGFALTNPHRYLFVFDAASPASSAPDYRTDLPQMGSSANRAPWASSHYALRDVVRRMIAANRIRDDGKLNVAGRLWSLAHGEVMLEVAGFIKLERHRLTDVLGSRAVNILVGMGDEREQAVQSLTKASALLRGPGE